MIPAASMAFWATGAICHTAQRNTVCPAMVSAGQSPREVRPSSLRIEVHDAVWEMTSHCAPSLPHMVGPIPGVSDGPMTTAPAPSPNRKAVPRS